MKYFLVIIFCLIGQFANSQSDSTTVKAIDSVPPRWIQKNKVGMDINEITFVNWSTGGSNSISALLRLESTLNYSKGPMRWKNRGLINFGVNKQQDQKLRKTSDELELSSTLGYQQDSLSNWFFSARFNFKTQFINGYNYPNRNNPISSFMAPGYVFTGAGVEYGKNIEKFSTYFSPVTFKSTFVLDKELSNAGSFGVRKAILDMDGNVVRQGERVRTEIGILVTNEFETEVFENIKIKSRSSLYTDYLNSFGNIDVDWEVMFDFKVNQYVKASLGSHLKYDNDVKTIEESSTNEELVIEGAKIQWKQILGIGAVVNF